MDRRSGDLLVDLYKNLSAPLIRTDMSTAEMVKYTDNVWHALKVSFANEIGNLLAANQKQVERGLSMILSKGNKEISVLGFSLKVGTDDLR